MDYQGYKDYSLNLAAESVSSSWDSMFNTNKQANGMTEDPLNSKWTKDSGATFNQSNVFNTVVPVDEIGQILEYVRGIARQVGV